MVGDFYSFFSDFSKFREENNILNIMRNCLYEVKRDIMMKKSKYRNKQFQKTKEEKWANSELLNEIRSGAFKLEDLSLEQKYQVVKNLMGHSYMLDKLRDIIDSEMGQSDTFLFYQGKKVKRDITRLNELKMGSPSETDAGELFSQKSTASKNLSRGVGKTRSKFLRFV